MNAGTAPSRVAPHAARVRVVWMLLVFQPGISLAYLWSVRQHWLPPTFFAPMALAVLPLVAASLTLLLLRSAPAGKRGHFVVALLLAAVELGWCVLVAAMVGFAIALRSG
ncbi:MAG: hypothetical protein KatS3mg077_2694 [Candidatus Binatia bacterium]|nr:MAG: hypothetical protein KatS3mg077_2694 [Candidatus Binatia bacterium]